MLTWHVLKHCLSLASLVASLVLRYLTVCKQFSDHLGMIKEGNCAGVLTSKGDLDWHKVIKRLKEREEIKRKDRDIRRRIRFQDFTEVGVLGVMTPSEHSCTQNWRASLCQEAQIVQRHWVQGLNHRTVGQTCLAFKGKICGPVTRWLCHRHRGISLAYRSTISESIYFTLVLNLLKTCAIKCNKLATYEWEFSRVITYTVNLSPCIERAFIRMTYKPESS